MDMIPITPERKAQLDEYSQRHGQDPASSTMPWPRGSIGSGKIIKKRWKASGGDTRTSRQDARGLRKKSSRNYARSMAFRVEHTSSARHDLDAILEWLLAHEAGETGLRWFRKVHAAASPSGIASDRGSGV